jgi:hypothetical protein
MMGEMAALYQSMSMKFNAAAPPCRMTFGVFPLQNAKNPSSWYTVLATLIADPDMLVGPLFDIEPCNCISNLTRSMGATAVLANAPAAAPASASFNDPFNDPFMDVVGLDCGTTMYPRYGR